MTDSNKASDMAQLMGFTLNQSPDAIYWMSPDGTFLNVNDTACRMLGYSREELRTMGAADIDPNITTGVSLEMSGATKKAGSGQVQSTHRAKDGRLIPVDILVEYFEHEGKEYHCAFVRDISKQKATEEAMRQQIERVEKSRQAMLFMMEDLNASGAVIQQAKEEWEQTFDAVTDPIFSHDREFRILRANQAYAEQAGMDIKEVIGKLYWKVFPKGDGPLPGCVKAMEKAEEEEVTIEDSRIFLSRTYTSAPETGSHHHVSIHVMQDITERTRTRNALAVQARIASIFSTANAIDESFNEVLKVVQDALHSPFGVFGYLDKEGTLVVPAMTRQVWDKCDVPGKSIIFPRDAWGDSSWPNAIRKKRVIYSNEPSNNILEGHVCIQRHISMPILLKGEVIGLFQVANRDTDYTENDISILSAIAQHVAPLMYAELEQAELLEIQQRHLAQIEQNLKGTIAAIALAVEARDPYTAGHQRRVSDLATAIAQQMGLEQNRLEGIRMGATIHDIGKIHLPAEILSKPAKLSNLEYSLIQAHSQSGYDILKNIEFPWPVADIAYQHHERMDGTGYPQGLKGQEICLEARIVSVADVVEAMCSHRPYRPGLGIKKALAEIKRGRNSTYGADVVDACLKLFTENRFAFTG